MFYIFNKILKTTNPYMTSLKYFFISLIWHNSLCIPSTGIVQFRMKNNMDNTLGLHNTFFIFLNYSFFEEPLQDQLSVKPTENFKSVLNHTITTSFCVFHQILCLFPETSDGTVCSFSQFMRSPVAHAVLNHREVLKSATFYCSCSSAFKHISHARVINMLSAVTLKT